MSKELDARLAALIERCDETDRLIVDIRRFADLESENAKLRELCASLYEFAMSEYPDGTELNFADRMRKLGVEVD